MQTANQNGMFESRHTVEDYSHRAETDVVNRDHVRVNYDLRCVNCELARVNCDISHISSVYRQTSSDKEHQKQASN